MISLADLFMLRRYVLRRQCVVKGGREARAGLNKWAPPQLPEAGVVLRESLRHSC